MAPFHFFKLSGPIIAGIFSRRMPEPDLKPVPLPSKTIHCRINPIFASYSVSNIQSGFKTLNSGKLSSSSLLSPLWMQHFAMAYAFTEVAVQTSAILAFYINQSVGKVGAKEEGKVQIELRPWQALLKTWEAAKARGDWGSELETQKSLDRIEKLLSNLNNAYAATESHLENIEHMIGELKTKLEGLEREKGKEEDGGGDKKGGWIPWK